MRTRTCIFCFPFTSLFDLVFLRSQPPSPLSLAPVSLAPAPSVAVVVVFVPSCVWLRPRRAVLEPPGDPHPNGNISLGLAIERESGERVEELLDIPSNSSSKLSLALPSVLPINLSANEVP